MDTIQGNLAMELKQLRDVEGVTFQALANQTGIVSRSTISQVANQGLHIKPEWEARLWEVIREIRGQSAQGQRDDIVPPTRYKTTIELYETKEFKEAMGWCSYVYAKRKMGVLVGHPGSGKTTILRQFSKARPGVLYIEAWHTMRMGDLLGAIGRALGVTLEGSNNQGRVLALIAALQGRDDVMIAVDEAEYLCPRNVDKLEVLRKIWDNTGTPVILCGTPNLERLLTQGRGGENLAQLYRRKVELKLGGITGAEARALLREYNITTAATEALATIASDVRHGGMGTFVEILDLCLEAAEGGQITEAILAGAKRYKLMY